MNIKPFLKTALKFGKKHSTKILAGCAIIAEGLGFWFMHKSAPIVHEKIKELGPDAKTWDKIKVAAPIYLPAALMLVTSSGCIIGGCAIGEAKLAAMTNIAMATDAALMKTNQKLIEVVGEEKAQEIHNEIAKDIMMEKNITSDQIITTPHGADYFFEPLSGRLFTSSESFIHSAVEKVNSNISYSSEMEQTVNSFYDELELPQVKLGNGYCWDPDNKLKIEIVGNQDLINGHPYATIVYYNLPKLPSHK